MLAFTALSTVNPLHLVGEMRFVRASNRTAFAWIAYEVLLTVTKHFIINLRHVKCWL